MESLLAARSRSYGRVLVLLGCAGSLATTQQPPTFPSEVARITVDAVVVDGQGRPVSGLTRDDFVLELDGQPREIVSFEAFEAEAQPEEAQAPPVVASNADARQHGGRSFTLIVDDARMSQQDVEQARRALATFFERSLRPGDEVSLGTSSSQAWWSARLPEGREDLEAVAARIQGHADTASGPDALSDYEAFWIDNHETSAGRLTERVVARWTRALVCFDRDPGCPALVRGRARTIEAYRVASTRLTLQALQRGLAALGPMRGRKSVVLLSPGFLEDSSTALREVVAAAREVNAAVYFVDVRGLQAQPDIFSAGVAGSAATGSESGAQAFEARTLEAAGAQSLAEETGGFTVRNTNDLGKGVERVVAESRVFYLLGIAPTDDKPEGAWRKLRVQVKRSGLTVRARRGYTQHVSPALAVKPAGKAEHARPGASAAVAGLIDSAHDADEIPLRAMAYVLEPRPKDLTHVVLGIELDAGRIPLQNKGRERSTRLEVSVVAVNRDSGRGFRHDDVLELKIPEQEPLGWRGLTREFELPTGVTQARVVVRDPATGALGSVSQRFLVPFPGELRLTTPIVTDRLAPKQAGQTHPEPALAVHRVFPPGGQLFCQFEVLGAKPGGGGAAAVLAGLELRTAAGRVLRKAEPTPVTPDPDGRLVRLVGLGLEGLPEGAYDLVLQIRDEQGGELEQHEPFRLAQDGSAS